MYGFIFADFIEKVKVIPCTNKEESTYRRFLFFVILLYSPLFSVVPGSFSGSGDDSEVSGLGVVSVSGFELSEGLEDSVGFELSEDPELPEGFELSVGFEVSEDSELPEGFELSVGFEVSEDSELSEGFELSVGFEVSEDPELPEGFDDEDVPTLPLVLPEATAFFTSATFVPGP